MIYLSENKNYRIILPLVIVKRKLDDIYIYNIYIIYL